MDGGQQAFADDEFAADPARGVEGGAHLGDAAAPQPGELAGAEGSGEDQLDDGGFAAGVEGGQPSSDAVELDQSQGCLGRAYRDTSRVNWLESTALTRPSSGAWSGTDSCAVASASTRPEEN